MRALDVDRHCCCGLWYPASGRISALVSALKRWKLACPPGPFNLVFPTSDGAPKHRSTITHRGLRPALLAAKLRTVTLHSLRHTFASALIAKHAPPTEIAYLLGHSSPAVTMKIYAHWLTDVQTKAVASVTQVVLGGSKVVAETIDGAGPDAVNS